MPRRGTDRKYADSIALSFYRAKLRANPALRRACSDRHVLDDTIDQWKAEELLDGRQIKGVPRSAIIFSLKGRWKLIDSKANEANVIVWRDEVDDRNNDEDGVPDAINANDKRRRRKTDRKHTNSIALSFYKAKLRGNPTLLRACSDRHVLDDTIDQWKAEELLDGRQITGVSRSNIISGLMVKWKLIDSKVTEENVIVWRDEVDAKNAIDANDKASRIAKTVKRIRSSRLELESNRNGLTIDNIDLGAECEESICRIGYWATQQVSIRNESGIDLYCTVKGDAAGQRNIIVEGDSRFELRAGSSNFIKVSFLPKVMGITKSIVVFDFAPIDLDEDDPIGTFSIARYIHIRAGDPDDYAILKPTAPYIQKKRRDDDPDKFSNPVRVRSTVVKTPFVNPLGKYPIPGAVQTFAPNEKDAMRKMDNFFRGKGSYFDGSEQVDYSSCLTIDNYATCMQLLLWIEEVQMNVDIKSYDLVDTPLMREGRIHYKLLVPGLAENRPSVLKGDTILIHVRGGSNFKGLVHRTTQEYAPPSQRVHFHDERWL